MSFNGSGVFQRLYSWVNDAAGGIKIRADRMDNEMNGFATGLSSCITKDGQTTVTANLPMAGFRHTGVGSASARTDYATFGQVQDGKAAWVDGAGTADAITAAYSIPITALVDGQLCYVRATAPNATTTPTFSPSALTARTIVKQGGAALAVGDIAGDGHELILRYDLTNTRWELLNPKSANIPYVAPTSSTAAYMDFAEGTSNGSNRLRLSAPDSLSFDATSTLPFAGGTLVAEDNNVTLTNKTINLASNTLVATSAQLRAAVSDETGTGALVFAGGNIGAATATSINFGGSSLSNYVAAGSWTPVPTGLTVVGTPTYTGVYTRIGNLVFCTLGISSTTTTASTSGTTYFTGLPFSASGNVSSVGASNAGNGVAFSGTGVVFAGTDRAYTPTWSATQNVQVSFWYFA